MRTRNLGKTNKLTRREIEVLRAAISGDQHTDIAKSLFISKRTVDFHLVNAYQKLGVNNKLQAIKKASELNLIPYGVTDYRGG